MKFSMISSLILLFIISINSSYAVPLNTKQFAQAIPSSVQEIDELPANDTNTDKLLLPPTVEPIKAHPALVSVAAQLITNELPASNPSQQTIRAPPYTP